MRFKAKNYNQEYKVLSLALNNEVREDLEREAVEQLFIKDNVAKIFPQDIELEFSENDIERLKERNNYDVFELWEDGTLYLQYDASSVDNYFFITGKCNSNCIMCPSPDEARKNQKTSDINNQIKIAQHIPEDTPHLTITGGEPFMAGEDIFKLINFIRNKFRNTELLVLTNGRIFCIKHYLELFDESRPELCVVGIPIHGSNSAIHDKITQAEGSFEQTVCGVKNLLSKGITVELRIVVSKLNINDMYNIAELVVDEMSSVDHVSIMAMEMTGSAHRNRDKVWIPYGVAFRGIIRAIQLLINNGINVKLYNFPLCTVSKEYWPLCEKSISVEKIKYGEECTKCRYKDACGGIFAGTYLIESEEIKAIV